MAVRTYDPKKVLLSFASVPLSGYAPGTFVEVEYDEDAFSKKVGASGEVTRELNQNRGAKVTVTLMQASQSNDALSALANADRQLGTGVGAFLLKEVNGTTLIIAPDAWIQKMPKVERGKESSEAEWTFDLADAEVFVGGLTS